MQLATGNWQRASCNLTLPRATTTSLQAHLSHCVSPPKAHASAIETLNQLTPTATGVRYSLLEGEGCRGGTEEGAGYRGATISLFVSVQQHKLQAQDIYTLAMPRDIPLPSLAAPPLPPRCCGCHSWRSALAAAQTSEHIIVN